MQGGGSRFPLSSWGRVCVAASFCRSIFLLSHRGAVGTSCSIVKCSKRLRTAAQRCVEAQHSHGGGERSAIRSDGDAHGGSAITAAGRATGPPTNSFKSER